MDFRITRNTTCVEVFSDSIETACYERFWFIINPISKPRKIANLSCEKYGNLNIYAIIECDFQKDDAKSIAF